MVGVDMPTIGAPTVLVRGDVLSYSPNDAIEGNKFNGFVV